MLLKKNHRPMDQARQTRLETAGWKVGTIEDFLGLTADEAEDVELRLHLSDAVRRSR